MCEVISVLQKSSSGRDSCTVAEQVPQSGADKAQGPLTPQAMARDKGKAAVTPRAVTSRRAAHTPVSIKRLIKGKSPWKKLPDPGGSEVSAQNYGYSLRQALAGMN